MYCLYICMYLLHFIIKLIHNSAGAFQFSPPDHILLLSIFLQACKSCFSSSGLEILSTGGHGIYSEAPKCFDTFGPFRHILPFLCLVCLSSFYLLRVFLIPGIPFMYFLGPFQEFLMKLMKWRMLTVTAAPSRFIFSSLFSMC